MKERWLKPLLNGEIRSAYAMTEPDVASSDATNISMSCVKDGDEWVLNGEKHWISGAGDPRCKVYITMVKTGTDDDPKHKQHSMVVVPADTPGIEILRAMTVMGMDDAPHGHMHMRFTDVRVPLDAMLLGEGRGFEISQGRLGPGRIHHCMRAIGQAELALELMCKRSVRREAFGKPLAQLGGNFDTIADARMAIEQARSVVPESSMDDGSGRRPGCRSVDLADQGRRTVDGVESDRRCHADARRCRHFAGHATGDAMVPSSHLALCGWPRCRSPSSGGPRRIAPVHAGETDMKSLILKNDGYDVRQAGQCRADRHDAVCGIRRSARAGARKG